MIIKKLSPVQIVKVDENLETEDILELANSGAIKITVADSHIAEIWPRVFDSYSDSSIIYIETGMSPLH